MTPADRRGSPPFLYLDTCFDYRRDWRSLYRMRYGELLFAHQDTEMVLLPSGTWGGTGPTKTCDCSPRLGRDAH